MKTTKWMSVLCAVVFIFGTIACGGGKYADAKKVVAKSNKVLEGFLGKMDKVDNAKDVAAALTGFTSEMEKIVPELKKLEEKYPDLRGSQGVPEELGEEGKKMMELWGKFASVMMKIQEYGDDPEVQKAQEKFEDIMKGL
ncbi:MAG: hypothetical protein WA915_09940 [Candidatus Aminicenantaceae bacterium]|jgi:hypothetical protein